jgi:hypothetical protein
MALESEARMATVEECRKALENLTGRLMEIDEKERADFFTGRTVSCKVTDLDVTFVTTLGDAGANPVREATPSDPPADIRLTAKSDVVISLADAPANIAREWIAGRVKIEASMRDLFRLRKLL